MLTKVSPFLADSGSETWSLVGRNQVMFLTMTSQWLPHDKLAVVDIYHYYHLAKIEETFAEKVYI